MFHQLYQACLKNSPLLKIAPTSMQTPECRTFQEVLKSSSILGFFFTSVESSACSDFSEKIRILCKTIDNDSSVSKTSPKIRRFLSGKKRKEKKTKENASKNNFSLVVVCVDIFQSPLNLLGDSGWFVWASESIRIKTALMRALEFQQSPALVLLDCDCKQIITVDGKRALQDDPIGKQFPWYTPSLNELLQGGLLRNCIDDQGVTVQESVHFKDVHPCVKALFFGANWCPPCRIFEKQLTSAYANFKAKNLPLEVFFCSSDRSEQSFRQHFSTMPWLTFPFDEHRLRALTRLFNVHGIPALLLVDEQNRLITRHGRNAILSDPEGLQFPWESKSLYELNQYTLCRLKDHPSLVLFTEGSSEDIVFSLQVLQSVVALPAIPGSSRSSLEGPTCLENGPQTHRSSRSSSSCSSSDWTNGDPMDPTGDCDKETVQLFYAGDDPVCDAMLDNLGLEEAALPLLLLVDILAGTMSICDHSEVSPMIVQQFLADFRADRLEMVAMTTANQRRATVPIGRAMLGLGPSPSQTDMNADGPKKISERQ